MTATRPDLPKHDLLIDGKRLPPDVRFVGTKSLP